MSAIAGLLSLDRSVLDPEPAERMVAALAARGPHDDGSYRSPDGRAVLAARRLATIAPGESAAQPLANETHDLWLVLDGEVLNHRALRHSLELVGHRFRTGSDAEVAVHAYEQWGLDFLTHLHGAFALALWDDRRDRLVLARDRLGRKPLFLAERRGRLAFATAIAPLLDELRLPRGIDPAALGQYLALGYVPPPRTLAAGITKLAAGEMLVVERGTRPRRRRWGRPEPDERHAAGVRALSADRHRGNLRTLLECSVADRLIGDVRLGLLLDSGIASVAVASVVARFTGQAEKAVAVFDAAEPDGATARALRLMAGWARCDRVDVPVSAEDFAAARPEMVAALPEPVADEGQPAAWFAARASAAMGVRALLSGAGAEEVLLCHPAYGGIRPKVLDRLAALFGHRPASPDAPPRALAAPWTSLLGPEAQGRVPAPTGPTALPPPWMAGDARAARGLGDLRGWVAECAAPGLDAVLQGHGVEGRLPFLDEALLTYALAVPGAIRQPAILRRLLGDLIPVDVLLSPPPPALPLGAWLAERAGTGPLAEAGLLSPTAVLAPGSRWALAVLEDWCGRLGLDRLAEDQTAELALTPLPGTAGEAP